MDPRLTDEHLAELGRLTDTAGGSIVGTLRQRIDSPHPRYFIGEGKALELKDAIAGSGADLVIFDEELTPAQGKNLETLLGVRVMDRSELILDIFATRARTHEARLQVELAQLQYLLPRLTRMWDHLSRTRGGIGLRGPGETQLETDRRLIGERIADLKGKLRDVARARAIQRGRRAGSFRAALVGYTNAGKSSLLRELSGSDVFVEDRLFATLDSTTRQVDLGEGREVLVTDTVGFIRKLPHHLVASFRSTLEEAGEADLLLHVVDASHPDLEEHMQVVFEVLEELGLDHHPSVLVLNKVDRLTHAEEAALRDRVRAFEPVPSVFVSATTAGGVEPLRELLRARERARLRECEISIPLSDGAGLAEIHRSGDVIRVDREEGEERLRVVVRLSPSALGRLSTRPGLRIDGEGHSPPGEGARG